MKILKQEKKGCRELFEVEVDKTEFDAAYKKVLQEAANNINVPGFRPGKAPKNIIESNINLDAAKERTVDFLVDKYYAEILKESKIQPVDYPKWKLISLDDSLCTFSVEVDVVPQVKLGNYKGVVAKKQEKKIEEKDIDDYVKSVLEESAQVKEISDRPVKKADIAELDIEGSVGGHTADALSQRMLPILVGDNRIAPGFDDNIAGMSTGEEKTFTISLPADYFIKEYAEKEAVFKVSVKRIAERTLPQFDDELVQKISSFKTVEEYKSDVKERLQKYVDQQTDGAVKDELIEKVSAECEVDIPGSIINREIDTMMDEMASNLSRSGLTVDSYLKSRKITIEAMRTELKQSATSRAKAKLVLKQISDTEKLEVSDADLQKEIEEISKDSGASVEEYKTNEGLKDFVKEYLHRKKALDFILEHAKI